MKIKIINLNNFEKTNSIFFTRDINLITEYKVYASSEVKKNKEFLINFSNAGPIWIKNNSAIEILEHEEDADWINTPRLDITMPTGDYFNSYETVRYKNLHSPKWMIMDESFLYDIYGNTELARKKFLKNELKQKSNQDEM